MECSVLGSSAHGILQADNEVGCHFLFQGIFLTQGSNKHVLHWKMGSSPPAPPRKFLWELCPVAIKGWLLLSNVLIKLLTFTKNFSHNIFNGRISYLGRWTWQPTPIFLPGESHGQGSLLAAVCGVTQSQTRLKELSSSSSILPWEVDMATHSNILAWKIPWTEEPDRVQFTGSQRVSHFWSDWASYFGV